MTIGLSIARAWNAEDGTMSRLAEMINEAIAVERLRIAQMLHAEADTAHGANNLSAGNVLRGIALRLAHGK